jgi:hypothetical protein
MRYYATLCSLYCRQGNQQEVGECILAPKGRREVYRAFTSCEALTRNNTQVCRSVLPILLVRPAKRNQLMSRTAIVGDTAIIND